MVSTKRTNLAIIVLSMLVVPVLPAMAVDDPSTAEDQNKAVLTEEKSQAIMQNCSNIKQSLVQLQRADSRTRTYLGSAYEAVSGRFITPLNLRLVKNGTPSAELFRIQNEFTAQQNNFRNTYVDYMRELEALITIDCSTKPQDFYDKLELVRHRREDLHQITQQISKLVDEQYKTVEEIKDTL